MTNNLLELLIAERDKLNRAIAALQTEPARRGRPPRAQGGAGSSAPKKRRRGGMSAEARRAQSERMKAYWAKRRKQKAKSA